jgi:hypothetical protein
MIPLEPAVTSTELSAAIASFPLREERRPAALSGWLVRRGSDNAHDFLIDNLSSGGCRLQSAAKLGRGDQVHLHVLSRGAIPATVRWHNAHGIGLSFATERPARVEKPRKIKRLPVRSDLVVRRAGRRARAAGVSDLSRLGCCLTLDDAASVGERLWVTLPGLSPVEAQVRWTDGRRAGVEFVQPIHLAVFDLLLFTWNLGA